MVDMLLPAMKMDMTFRRVDMLLPVPPMVDMLIIAMGRLPPAIDMDMLLPEPEKNNPASNLFFLLNYLCFAHFFVISSIINMQKRGFCYILPPTTQFSYTY